MANDFTTRLSIPYANDPTDAFTIRQDIEDIVTVLDNAAMYEQGVLGSLPAGTSKPNGYWYADTASGGHIYVNVGTGGGRAYRRIPALDSSSDLTLPGDLSAGASIAATTEINAEASSSYRVRLGDLFALLGSHRAGISLGSALDVHISRSAAGEATVHGDLVVTDDLSVTDDASVGGTLSASDETYRVLRTAMGAINAGVVAGTYVLQENAPSGKLLAGSALEIFPFYFDPADNANTGKTTKLRIRASVGVGNTAPAITFTVGLYPVTGPTASLYVPGTVTSGSTVAFASPGANASAQGNSGDFNVPAAGYYALAVATSGTAAALSGTGLRATLQLRHV